MTKTYPYGQGPVKWVSTDWLAEHLDDPDLSILDVQPSVHDYIKEHVPGAIYLSEEAFSAPLNGVPTHYTPPEAAQAVLRRAGLRPAAPVVVGGGPGVISKSGAPPSQTKMAYALARFGHRQVYVLDGGLFKWKKEARPLVKAFPPVTESDFEVQVQSDLFVDQAGLKAVMGQEDVLLLDVRPQFAYEQQAHWSKPGHLPGAINLPWDTLVDTSNPWLLKPENQIQTILEDHGISPDKRIVCYCGTGRKASSTFLVLKWRLGFPQVKIYEGSFTDWSADPENPSVTGKNPF